MFYLYWFFSSGIRNEEFHNKLFYNWILLSVFQISFVMAMLSLNHSIQKGVKKNKIYASPARYFFITSVIFKFSGKTSRCYVQHMVNLLFLKKERIIRFLFTKFSYKVWLSYYLDKLSENIQGNFKIFLIRQLYVILYNILTKCYGTFRNILTPSKCSATF